MGIYFYDRFAILLDFWLKEEVAYEQPQVDYRYQTIVQLSGLRY